MSLTYSRNLPAPGDDIDADVLAALFSDIRAKFGTINGTDVDPAGAFPGSMIAAGSMPGDRIAPKTVTQDQIAVGAVGNPEIIDGQIKKGKLATTTGDQITSAQMGDRIQTINFNTILGGSSVTLGPATPVPVATNDIVGLFLNFSVPVNGCTVTLERGTLAGNHVVVFRAYGPGGSISGAADLVYRPKT